MTGNRQIEEAIQAVASGKPIGDALAGLGILDATDPKKSANVQMTLPLFIRFLEWAREDAMDDVELHKIAEAIYKAQTPGKVLDSADFDGIIDATDMQTERKLTSKARKRLGPGSFVYPGERRYPIHDLAHARNALARVSAHGTPAEQKKVRAAVYRKYPGLKKRKAEG